MATTHPLFFGSSDRRIYGVHHPPLAGGRRDVAVLLCFPTVHEYEWAHWAFRKLAASLSKKGFHVLRFDYRGTGDSSGEPEDSSVQSWCGDIADAAEELREMAEVPNVSLVGFRFGAALAAMASSRGLEVRDLVLWDPAVDGRAYVRNLRELERWGQAARVDPRPTNADELLGYPFPADLQAEMEKVTIADVAACRARRVLLVAGEDQPEHRALADAIATGGPPVIVLHVNEPTNRHPDTVLLSTRPLVAITSALEETIV